MKAFMKGAARELAAPLLRRLGAIGAAYLIAKGVPAGTAEQLMLSAAVFFGLVFDSAVILWQQGSN